MSLPALRRAWWPWRPLWLWFPGVLVLVLEIAFTAQMLGWNYVDWPAVSALPSSSLIFLGPTAAGAASYVTAVLWNRRSAYDALSAARPGASIAVTHLTGLSVPPLLGLLVGLTPALALAATRATGAEPEWVLIVYAPFVLLFFVVAGAALGVVLPLRYTPLAVFVGAAAVAFLGSFVPSNNPSMRFVTPVLVGDSRVGLSAIPSTWLWRTILLCLATGAIAWLMTQVTATRYRPAYWLIALAPLAVTLVVIGAVASFGPRLYGLTPNLGLSCTSIQGVEVCVADAQLAALPSVAQAVSDTIEVVGGPPPGLQTVRSDILNPNRRPPPEPWVDDSPDGTVWVSVTASNDLRDAVAYPLASYLSGIAKCEELASSGPAPDFARPGEISSVIARLARQGGQTSDFATWYRANRDLILGCQAPSLPPSLQEVG